MEIRCLPIYCIDLFHNLFLAYPQLVTITNSVLLLAVECPIRHLIADITKSCANRNMHNHNK